MTGELSAAGEVIADLFARGYSYEAIGQAVGRNRSLIRQIGTARKPGNNLQAALEGLRDRLAGGGAAPASAAERKAQAIAAAPAEKPAPRTRKSGTIAGVRRPRTIAPPSGAWSSTTLKRQAMASGGDSALYPIRDAADRGQRIAVSAVLVPSININTSSGGRRPHLNPKRGHVVEMELGDAGEVWADLDGGNLAFSTYLLTRLMEAGYIDLPDGEVPDRAILEAEVRTY